MLQRIINILRPKKLTAKYDLPYEQIYRLEERTVSPPCININIHNYCNAKCDMCPVSRYSYLIAKGKMSFDLFRRIIDEYRSFGYGTVTFCQNGEVFALPDAIEYIRYAVLQNLNIYIVTNASLLDPRKIDSLIKMGYNGNIYLSFHGINKSTYEKTMGLDYERTLRNINYLVKKYKKVTFIRSLSHNFEPGEKERVERYWNRRGIPVMFDQTHTWAGTVDANLPIFRKIQGCIQPLNQMCIDYNGDVYLCCIDLLKQVVLGNITEVPMSEIWTGRAFTEILEDIFNNTAADDFFCRKCHAVIRG